MKVLLEALLPRLYPGLSFQCVPHEGKQDLEKSIPRKLRAWTEPGVRFCIIRDNDGADCLALKRRLAALCAEAGRPETLVRIACQELEAWYFGDPKAVARAYELNEERFVQKAKRSRFRDPDAITGPAQALTELVKEFQKVSGARRIGPHLGRDNRSASYRMLLTGMDRLRDELNEEER